MHSFDVSAGGPGDDSIVAEVTEGGYYIGRYAPEGGWVEKKRKLVFMP